MQEGAHQIAIAAIGQVELISHAVGDACNSGSHVGSRSKLCAAAPAAVYHLCLWPVVPWTHSVVTCAAYHIEIGSS